MGKRRLLIIILFVVGIIPAIGQVGNEWIKFNQFYYKIPTAKEGIYKVTYNALLNAGFPVGAVDPRRLQLFHRGVEQAIYVEGEADANFGASDFIEFYGQRNDGTLDGALYKPSTLQPHPYYNLHSDTTSYFLTFNPLPVFGKRMENFSEVNALNLPKETFHTDDILLVLHNTYFSGVSYSEYVHTSFFDDAEGWTGTEIRQNEQPADYLLANVTQHAQSQGLPQLEVLIIGRNLGLHQTVISVGTSAASLRAVATNNFFGYTKSLISVPIAWTDVSSDGKLAVRVTANGVDGQPDRVSVSYIRLRYPQNYNSNGATEKTYNLAENGFGKSYIEIENPATGLRIFDVTNSNNVVRIGTTITSTLNAVVATTATSRKLYTTTTILTPPVIKRVTFRQINPTAHNYIIISHRQLMKAALGYADAVRAFGGYRASTAGGSYDTLVMDVNQLYDQFNYGETSPLAIFQFMKFMSSNPPKYLFIIGKGLTVDYDYYRNPGGFTTYKNYVPAAGTPPSDMFYTVGLLGTRNQPAIPTGRLSASKPADVAAYLNKVMQMEALPFDGLWRKNLLHLSGGINSGEPERFRTYMTSFQDIAEDFHLGGNVKAVPKRSTNIQLINVSEEVNKGLNMITFYGHSSPGATDFDIGFASDAVLGYNNIAKYPTLLMNGCNVGSFFLDGIVFGEDWVNTPLKGAIGFIAHSSFGFEGLLKQYSDTFYGVGYGDSTFIYKGLGDIQKEVAARLTGDNPSIYEISQAQQMVLLGDPAVKLFGARKPDYEINDNNLFVESFDGSPISVRTDSFALRLIVRNFGQAKEDSLLLRLTRTFEDNSTVIIHKLFPPVKYADTLFFVIKKEGQKGFGNNAFEVKLDADGDIAELNENNNIAKKGFLIPLNGTKNVFPSDYSIVKGTQVNLVFQTTNLISDERNFLVEIDTSYAYTSPFKKQFTVKGKVLAKQLVTLITKDSLAYYWRTKLAEPLPGENIEWTTSSFTYILNGSDGWAQVSFPQYLKNQSVGLVKDAVQRRLKFEETETKISIKTFGSASTSPVSDVSVKINNAEYNINIQGGACRTNTINLLAFDKTSTVPYAAIPFRILDPRSCGREPQVIVNFIPSELKVPAGDDMIQSIENIVAGDSIILFSIGDAGYASWPAEVIAKMGELGIAATQIQSLTAGEPVVIYGKKGAAPGSAKVYKASTAPLNQQTLQVDETITGRYTAGKMNSVLIGPSQQWVKFSQRIREKEVTDQFSVDIIGVKLDGSETVIFADATTDKDLSGIDVNQYPFLRINYKAEDGLNLTPVQLRNWIVIYEPVAEGLLIYRGNGENNVVREGESWSDDYGFVNISDRPFTGSLKVRYEIFNKTTRQPYVTELDIAAPLPSDTTKFSISTTTTGKSGLNDVTVFVNPRLVPEQHYDNNVIELPEYLQIEGDLYNPVLDVTIDGRYVEREDFVSPSPTIKISVWDENVIALKKDTVGITISLQYPCEAADCSFKRINFSRNDVTWMSATDTSYFTVLFKPQNLPEGKYTLRVEMVDANGNLSGEDPYQISFLVDYASSFKFFDPHPNPSNASFYFDFVVSGETAPEECLLQIVSVEGKVLNEMRYTQDAFRIGINNIVWNGKDAGGNEQPAGVYIYHFVLKTSVKEIRKNGKVVIVR